MLFTTIGLGPPRYRAFIPSVLIHFAGILLVGLVWVSAPMVPVLRKALVMNVVAPVRAIPERALVRPAPAPSRRVAVAVPKFESPAPRITIPAPALLPAPPKAAAVVIPAPAITVPAPSAPKPSAPPELFSMAAPAPVNPKPALPVQIGAFETTAVKQTAAAKAAPAAAGVFQGAEVQATKEPNRAAIVSTGFGEVQQARPAARPAEVASAAFGSVQTAAPAAPQRAPVKPSAAFGGVTPGQAAAEVKREVQAGNFESVSVAAARPKERAGLVSAKEVEILFKPRPTYTEEARRLKIEGEVLVAVVFMASGQVRVERVVKGLGHGLDETALNAAANIRFKPAERDGRPVDSAATARITFSLAY